MRRSLAGLLALFLCLASAAAAAGGTSEAFVRDTADRVFSSFSAAAGGEQRATAFREVLVETFELETAARFALGRYWRIASPGQRREYLRLFEDFLVLVYTNRFGDLSGVTLRIVGTRTVNQRDRLVLSEAVTAGGRPPLRIGWRVRETGKGLRIVDVFVDGISMSVTQRDQFAAVIRSSGGKVEGLLKMLREKTGPGR